MSRCWVTSRIKFQSLSLPFKEHVVVGLDKRNSTALLTKHCPDIEAQHAEQIVQWCGGVPLAISIAAGIMKFDYLSAAELLQDFHENGIEAIQPGGDWLKIEDDLVAMITSAVNRLPERLQTAFSGLSLFCESFTGEAGAAVVGANSVVQLKKDYTTHLPMSMSSRV